MTRAGVKRWVLALVAVLAVAAHRPAAAEDAGTVLEEILNIMRQSGQITEEQKKALIERAQQEARMAEAEREKQAKELSGSFTAGIENYRPYFRTNDGDFKFELGGRLQVDFDAAEPGARALTGAELKNRFLVRRARLELAGTMFKWIDLKLEADFAEDIILKDAYLDFRFLPEAALRGGQFKVPFSREELTSSRFINFVERSVLNDLAPAREQGVMVHGRFLEGVLAYQFGVFNGVPEEAPETNTAKELAGRLVVQPFRTTSIELVKGVYLGGNFTWEPATELSAQGRTGARTDPRFRYFASQPTHGDKTRFGGDISWVWGPVGLFFEYDQQRDQRNGCGTQSGGQCTGGADLADVIAQGFYVEAMFIVTGETKPLAGPVIPKRNFSPLPGKLGPGAWEVGVRYAQLDFTSDDPVDFFDGNITNGITGGGRTAENGVDALTVGVNWYLNPRTRMMFNWTNYWYDNELGTPFSCDHDSCSAADLERRGDTSWEILTRMQVWF
jgi:phosphate-selective porin OprO/OprP